MHAPGPLGVSAVALFGNESWFGMAKRALQWNTVAAAVDLCQSYRMPFITSDEYDFHDFSILCTQIPLEAANQSLLPSTTYGPAHYGSDITQQLLSWFVMFNNTSFGSQNSTTYNTTSDTSLVAVTAIGIATFYANEALLTLSAQDEIGGRPIYPNVGRTTQRPFMSLPSMIILTVLLIAEVIGLVLIAFYAWRTPAWTNTLTSLTVAQLAHHMDKGFLPPPGSGDTKHVDVLHQLDGRVGVAVVGNNDKSVVEYIVHGGPDPFSVPQLRKTHSF
jgi:hypothetical protein